MDYQWCECIDTSSSYQKHSFLFQNNNRRHLVRRGCLQRPLSHCVWYNSHTKQQHNHVFLPSSGWTHIQLRCLRHVHFRLMVPPASSSHHIHVLKGKWNCIVVIDCEAREIMRLVASVHPFVCVFTWNTAQDLCLFVSYQEMFVIKSCLQRSGAFIFGWL